MRMPHLAEHSIMVLSKKPLTMNGRTVTMLAFDVVDPGHAQVILEHLLSIKTEQGYILNSLGKSS